MTAHPGINFPGLGCGLAILRDERLLLYRRVKAPEAGHWNIVGGKIDHMERSDIAARREAEEESGLSVGAIDFLCLSEQVIPEDRQRDIAGEARVVEPDKLPEFGWFALDALPSPLSRFAADAIAALKRQAAAA